MTTRQENRNLDSSTSQADYRSRIYDQYVAAGAEDYVPSNVAGLAPRAAYLRTLLSTHFPANRDVKVLDLGCGHGALLHFAHEAGYCNATGVDRSPEQVHAAAQLGIKGVREGDLMEEISNAEQGSLDVVVTFDVIEHLRKEELALFIDQVFRALVSGGRWIVHVPNAASPFFGMIRYGDFTHELAFTKESLKQITVASGFRKIDCFEDAPVVHGVRSAVRAVLWRAIRLGLRAYLAAETGRTSQDVILTQNLLAVAIK